MKPIIMALFAVCLCFVFTVASSQSYTRISGRVIDDQQRPVNAATAALLKAGTSTPVKIELSDKDGHFQFEKQTVGTYRIIVTAIGFIKYESNPFQADSSIVLPVFKLQKSDIELKEVNVTASKKFIEQKIDRTVVNVDALISNAGTTALDVLEKSPGVQVDLNGNISLKGLQGVTIYIDDKQTYLSGSDLQNYLRSLPASLLSQIEIMPNPPAKYDAAGNGGIINIKTLKRKPKGFNFGFNSGTRVSKYTSINNSAEFNYRNNKVNLFGNFFHGTRNSYNDVSIFRKYFSDNGEPLNSFTQNSYIHRTGYGFRAALGADFHATEKTTLGINTNGLIRYPVNLNTSTGTMINIHNNPDSIIQSLNRESGVLKNGNVNLNMRHEFRKNGPSLLVNLDYINYTTENDQNFNNKNYLSDGTLKSEEQLVGQLPSNLDIYVAKADYNQSLRNGFKLETGVKTSFTKTNNIANYFNIINNTSYPDYDITNHFNYKENINGAYISLNKEFKRLSVQTGLRFENTTSKGHQLGNLMKSDSSFIRTYNNLFPTVFLLYKLDTLSNHQIRFNYGRRIDRPYFQDLNPFISPLDKYTFYAGNPYLLPSFSTKAELSYIFKNWLTTTVAISKTKDQVNETIEIIGNNYYSRPGNIGQTTLINFGLDANLNPLAWFSFQVSSQLTYVHAKSNFYTGLLDTRSTYIFSQGMLQFKLKKKWTMQLDGYFQSKMTSAQFIIASRGRVNAGVAKVLSPKATIRLSISDLFFTNINAGTINNLHLTDANFRTLSDSRSATLSFSLRFGKSVEGQKRNNNQNTDAELNRIK
ncbi:TonB-dependent receptor [Chitinophaga silvatica]|uniref:TonB-dependent receptor n=1 Tax=Chitinophaga silvatica TaxID=2282649 RepID=A0A3E1Y7F4_9BACT|nr:TonB-dependent receptor [Chitinophaga silvatica]RFS20673.1 TonB-dependent receptor [Chitinophaga silvatica]